jgi:hypothetical protein
MKHSRRLFQISLKNLFVLVLVVAAFFAGWGIAERRAEREIQRARERARAEVEAEREEALARAIEQAEMNWDMLDGRRAERRAKLRESRADE